MEFITYYFTLLVMLASVLAAATCFSAYLVSRSRAMILAFGGFLCYFADVAFMLQDDIAAALTVAGAVEPSYLLARSVVTILIGDACLTFFWLFICDFVGVRNRMALAVPAIVFLLASLGLLTVADSPVGRFCLYSMRAAYILWMLGFALARYLTTRDEVERTRMARGKLVFALALVLTLLVIGEDAVFFLLLGGGNWAFGPVVISSERNYAENLLLLFCALAAITYAARSLTLRFERPPADDDEARGRRIGDNLRLYGNRHGLTDRECEVLRLILLGKDNQNIASTLTIAPSTVKVYVHRLLQKTECENRQTLIQDFWKSA